MTEAEKELLDLTAQVWNKYCALPEQHPMDKAEFCDRLHELQRFILARVGERELHAIENNVVSAQ